MANKAASSALEHASVILFSSLWAPILRIIDSQHVAQLLKERERYVLDAEAKQAEVPSLSLLPYTVRIDRSLLHHLVFMSAFHHMRKEPTVKTLSGENIKEYIKSLVSTSEVDPSRIHEALKGLKFPAKIASPSARTMTYCADVVERLEFQETIFFAPIDKSWKI